MGGIASAIVPIIGAIGGLFGGGKDEPSMPAAPAAPDTSAVDVKARADDERRRRIAAQQNATSVTGGQGIQGNVATSASKLG